MNWEDIENAEVFESAALTLCVGGIFAAVGAVMMAQDIGVAVCTSSTAFDAGCSHTIRTAAKQHAIGWGVVGVLSGAVWHTEAWELIQS